MQSIDRIERDFVEALRSMLMNIPAERMFGRDQTTAYAVNDDKELQSHISSLLVHVGQARSYGNELAGVSKTPPDRVGELDAREIARLRLQNILKIHLNFCEGKDLFEGVALSLSPALAALMPFRSVAIEREAFDVKAALAKTAEGQQHKALKSNASGQWEPGEVAPGASIQAEGRAKDKPTPENMLRMHKDNPEAWTRAKLAEKYFRNSPEESSNTVMSRLHRYLAKAGKQPKTK